jgi:ribosomal protein S10
MVDSTLSEVLDVLRQNSIPFTGPIPLATGQIRFRSSPSEVVHRRMLDVEVDKCPECIEAFNISIGVSVQMKQVGQVKKGC